MADVLKLEAANFIQVKQALQEAPDLAFKFVASELGRAAKRWKKDFIKKRMSGPPGISWGKNNNFPGQQKALGDNVKSWYEGRGLDQLKWTSKVSKFLRVHEEGATITPVNGPYLYLSRKTGRKGEGEIFAVVKSVTIPARLGFRDHWEAALPATQERVGKAMHRAVTLAFERRMQRVNAIIGRLAA